MQLSITREDLLKPLQQIIGAVERRQTMPALSNLLIRGNDQSISITATDLEVELVANLEVGLEDQGTTTIPARKLLDICRSLPDQAKIAINSSNEKVKVSSGRSRFSLVTLPAEDFPTIDDLELDQNSYTLKLKWMYHSPLSLTHNESHLLQCLFYHSSR